MHEALIENAEHDIDRDQRRRDKEQLIAQRALKRSRRSLKRGLKSRRQFKLLLDTPDRVRGLSERIAF